MPWTALRLYELDVLLIISHFVDKGLANLIRVHESISADESKRFFKTLIGTLSDITGPVVELIVDEVCVAM